MSEHFIYREAMVDIETLSLEVNAHILSIGIVAMHDLDNYLYFNIKKRSQNRHIDEDTAIWWANQTSEARKSAFNQKEAVTLQEALINIYQWYKQNHIKCIWSHGAVFDTVILDNAYKEMNFPTPWNFWEVRDTRTLIDTAQRTTGKRLEPIREGTYHNALDDAIHQAKWMNNILGIFHAKP